MVPDDRGAEPKRRRRSSNTLEELLQASARACRNGRRDILLVFDQVEPLISWLRASMAEDDEPELAADVRDTLHMLLDSSKALREAVRFRLTADDAYRTACSVKQELIRHIQGEADELPPRD